jgi:hypothetical protein
MPTEMAPPRIAVSIDAPRPVGAGSEPLLPLQDAKPQDPQPPLRIPQTDLFVEVLGQLPLRAKLEDVSRLLAQRHKAASINRTYPPTILELITLVKRNPAKPAGRAWDSIGALTIRYHPEPRHVVVEYCIDYCDLDPQTGSFHPRRKMVSYRAAEEVVEKRLDKKIAGLKKYSAPPFE